MQMGTEHPEPARGDLRTAQTPVDEQVQYLSTSLDELSELIDRLIGKVSPVLQPYDEVEAETSQKAMDEPRRSRSQLTEELMKRVSHIHSMERRVRDTIERVEL